VEDITEAADVGKGTFFNYFPSKVHVMSAFGQLQVGKVEAALADARSSKEPFREQLLRLMAALAEEPSRSPALIRSLLLAMGTSETVRNAFTSNLQRGRDTLAELLAIGQERREVRSDRDPKVLARVFQQCLIGTIVLWALHPPSNVAGWYEPLFSTIWSGMAAPAEMDSKE
jgi:AcrR family transcriptional regulator